MMFHFRIYRIYGFAYWSFQAGPFELVARHILNPKPQTLNFKAYTSEPETGSGLSEKTHHVFGFSHRVPG